MIHLFFADNNLYIRSGVYDKNSLPSGVLVFEGDLPKWEEPNKLVYRKEKIEILTPLEWTKHRVAIKELTLTSYQKIDANGNIVNKTILELLEEMPRKEAYDYLYKEISKVASKEITSGFLSIARGYPCRYDSSIEDQLNLKSKYDEYGNHQIRCIDSINGIKTFYFHTQEQVQIVYMDFIKHRDDILKRADEEKINLKTLFDSEKSVKEILLDFI